MKREKRLVDERRAAVLAAVREKRRVTVEELAEEFATSTMTIRRDLQVLEDEGYVDRYYGGASLREEEKTAPLTEDEELAAYRRRIAEYAARFAEEDDTMFINGSGTAIGLLDYLGSKSVLVITNNGDCMKHKLTEPIRLIVTGGRMLKGTAIMVGDSAVRNLDNTRADKAFLGFSGISENGEVICNIPAEVRINELMLANCREYFILADHTKIGRRGNFSSSELMRPGTIITDEKADPEVVERLRRLGMTVHQVTLKGQLVT